MNRDEILKLYPVGTVVELEKMEGESRMEKGLCGTVEHIDDIGQIHVKWENGSSLALNSEQDVFRKVNKIKILLVEPDAYPRTAYIDNNLESMQEVVDGYIEEFMPFEDDVAIICNEEGKMKGLTLNRAVYIENEKGQTRQIMDIIAGKFFIVHAPYNSEKFLSMPNDLEEKYKAKFRFPEKFMKINNDFVAVPYKPVSRDKAR